MSQFIDTARAWLAAISPELPPAALIICVFLTIYSVRRWFPSVWVGFEKLVPLVDAIDPSPGLKTLLKFWQAVPAALLAAVTGALMGGTSVRIAVWGVVTAAVTALSHEILADYAKFSGQVGGPLAPQTSKKLRGKPESSKPPSAATMMRALCAAVVAGWVGVGFVAVLNGCELTSKINWPAVAKCGPSPDDLIADVSTILLNSSDDQYLSEIEQLALKDGAAAVECAVQTVVSELTSSTARVTAKSTRAVARGNAFLASTGTKLEPAQ